MIRDLKWLGLDWDEGGCWGWGLGGNMWVGKGWTGRRVGVGASRRDLGWTGTRVGAGARRMGGKGWTGTRVSAGGQEDGG